MSRESQQSVAVEPGMAHHHDDSVSLSHGVVEAKRLVAQLVADLSEERFVEVCSNTAQTRNDLINRLHDYYHLTLGNHIG